MGILKHAKKKKHEQKAAPVAQPTDADEQAESAAPMPDPSADASAPTDDIDAGPGAAPDPDAAAPDANAPGGQPTEDESDAAAGNPGSAGGDPGGEVQTAAGDDKTMGQDGSGLPRVPATKQQQQAYDSANQALYHVLYGNDGPINAVVKGLQPQAKIDSCAKLSLLLLHQIDAKVHLDESIVLPFVKDIVSHVIDIAEQVKHMEFSPPEAQAVLGASLEGAIHMFGVTKQQVSTFLQHISPSQQQAATANYHGALQQSKQAQQQDPQDQGDSDAPSANQAAESQQAQGGQPPASGAPASGPPPQGGGGGQLSQAAQLQQQQQVLQQSAAQGSAGGGQ